MKILRIFNNNIVATMTQDKKEAIAQGSGIGFNKSVGDIIDPSKIEKFFPIQNNELKKFHQLFDQTPIEYFQIAEEIVEKAREFLNVEVYSQVILGLSDHIFFAVKREEEGLSIPNLMVDEIRIMYHKEFELAFWSLGLIKKVTGISLPEDEAGYIAMHLFNASMNLNTETTTKIILLTRGILDIIRKTFKIELNVEDYETSRLATHLKFLAMRIFKEDEEPLRAIEDLYEFLINKHSLMELCLNKILVFVKEGFSYDLSREEQVYLMVHLLKIIQ